MTITRETLDLAAKAAGVNGFYSENFGGGVRVNSDYIWQPHVDHGQLLDLAIACKIVIDPLENEITYVTKSDLWLDRRKVDCQDFPALAEAVITAAAEQQLAKEKKE